MYPLVLRCWTFIRRLALRFGTGPMNAQVNNKTESLNFRCWQPKDIEFIDYTQLSGLRTYVRSLCHIFSKAVYDIWPTATLNLEHPVSKGYYCVIHNGKNIDLETIEGSRNVCGS